VPFIRGGIRFLQLDQATFLERTFISKEGGWPLVGGAPDDEVLSIFTRVNLPLQGAGEGQTIELIIQVMHYLLLDVAAHDTDWLNGDISFMISETDGAEHAVLDGINNDTIDAGRTLRRSGSNTSHIGLS